MNAARKLLIPAKKSASWSGTIMKIEPQQAGFDYLTFEVRRLKAGESYAGETGSNELGIVALGGCFQARSSQGNWESVGGRANVFSGMPWALYLSVHTHFTITAVTDCELAFCYCRAEEVHPPQLISPANVKVEIRGVNETEAQLGDVAWSILVGSHRPVTVDRK